MTAAHKPRPVTPDDLFRFNFLLDARLSPDRAWVAYVVSRTVVEKDKEKDCSAIWLLSVETGETRQLTSGLANDMGPSWSPDGGQIAFVSNRGGKNQIYVIPVAGGEAQGLTSLPQGTGPAPVWSPDGSRIAFTAPPQTEPRNPAAPYRVTRNVYRFDALGWVDDVRQSIYIAPAEGGEALRLTDGGCHCSSPLWSPDGKDILYLLSVRPDSYLPMPIRAALAVVDLEGRSRVLVEEWGQVGSAAWADGGQSVVFAGIPAGKDIGTQSKLWLIGREGGTPVCRTKHLTFQANGGFQSDMSSFRAWQPRLQVSEDGKSAYVQVQGGGAMGVYRVALHGRESCAQVVAGERACYLMDMRGGRLLFAASTENAPPDLFVANDDGSGERQLTHLNDGFLAGLAMPTLEHLLFAGSDGVQVEGWLMKPTFGTAPYPTILYIHGGPHTAFGRVFHFDFQMLAGAGFAVLLVNHRASTGYGDAFATAVKGDWGNLDYKDLMAGLDVAIARGLVDPDRLGACGLSGGGNLSCWIVGQTDRFKAAVPENPVTNWVSFYGVSDIGPWFAVEELGGKPEEIPDVYRRCSPITYAHRCKTPTLMIQGESDFRCPPEQSEQFYAVLKANGCTVEMLRLPGSYHGGAIAGPPIIRRAQNEALLGWMMRHVLGKEKSGESD